MAEYPSWDTFDWIVEYVDGTFFRRFDEQGRDYNPNAVVNYPMRPSMSRFYDIDKSRIRIFHVLGPRNNAMLNHYYFDDNGFFYSGVYGKPNYTKFAYPHCGQLRANYGEGLIFYVHAFSDFHVFGGQQPTRYKETCFGYKVTVDNKLYKVLCKIDMATFNHNFEFTVTNLDTSEKTSPGGLVTIR